MKTKKHNNKHNNKHMKIVTLSILAFLISFSITSVADQFQAAGRHGGGHGGGGHHDGGHFGGGNYGGHHGGGGYGGGYYNRPYYPPPVYNPPIRPIPPYYPPVPSYPAPIYNGPSSSVGYLQRSISINRWVNSETLNLGYLLNLDYVNGYRIRGIRVVLNGSASATFRLCINDQYMDMRTSYGSDVYLYPNFNDIFHSDLRTTQLRVDGGAYISQVIFDLERY